MTLYTRAVVRRWFTDPWPNRDLDQHVDIIDAFNASMRQGLIARDEMYWFLRYLAGYKDYSRESIIKRCLLVLSTLLDLSDEQYARQRLDMQGITDEMTIHVKVAQMQATGLWDEPND